MRGTAANERRKGFLIDFDVVAMRRAQLKNVLMHLIPACIFLLVFFLSPSILVVKVISLTLAIISIVMFIFGVVYLLRNIANLTSMPRTVTVSDKGIDIDGNLFDYESYPDIKWERVSFGGELSLFDFYVCVAGRKYWTGNSFTDGAEAASNEVREAVLRLNPYERERRKNGRK